jgi:hypothetical protein
VRDGLANEECRLAHLALMLGCGLGCVNEAASICG